MNESKSTTNSAPDTLNIFVFEGIIESNKVLVSAPKRTWSFEEVRIFFNSLIDGFVAYFALPPTKSLAVSVLLKTWNYPPKLSLAGGF